MSENIGYWIGLDILEGAHVTVVIRHGCQEKEVEHFKEILHKEIQPLLPFLIQVGSEIVMRGYKSDVPTLDVSLIDKKKEDRLKEIYAKNYQQVEGHTAYPTLSMHMTINTEASLRVASIINSGAGDYLVSKAYLKQVGDKKTIDSVGIKK